jgi:lipopolysaccharide export LptBFGC system permease protein LptF
MGIDLRYPIGLLFVIFGLLLVFYGLFSGTAAYSRSLGIDVNLWWGLIMLVFGGLMFFAAYRKRSSTNKK